LGCRGRGERKLGSTQLKAAWRYFSKQISIFGRLSVYKLAKKISFNSSRLNRTGFPCVLLATST
jgi:hypothetical protein